ncbi:MAG: CoA-binding protein [Bacteroidota bacterium]
MNKPTLILGASENAERYSYLATEKLLKYGHSVYPVGIKAGKIKETDILLNKPIIENIDTLTLYVGPKNQQEWYDYILQINPKRLIFNPGTENEELQQLAQKAGITCIEACTLVMLSIGDY